MNSEEIEILLDFINESSEALESTEIFLLNLEDNVLSNESIDLGIVNSIFRAFHSIKGSAGFIGLEITSKVTHNAENLLDLIRKEKITLLKEHIDVFLELCDFLSQMIEHLKQNHSEDGFAIDSKGLIERLILMTEKDYSNESQNTKIKSEIEIKESPLEISSTEITQPQDLTQSLEMRNQFVLEALEILEQLEQDLLILEKNPEDISLIQSIFRGLHSIKGNAGFMNYSDINALTHKAETFLDDIRNGLLKIGVDQVSLLLQVLDFIKIAVLNIKETGDDEIPGKEGLLDLMDDIFGLSNLNSQTDVTHEELEEIPVKEKENEKIETPEVLIEDNINQINEEIKKLEESKITSQPINKVQNSVPKERPQNEQKEQGSGDVIRVDINKLNTLMDLVGEIVISESMVANHPDLANLQMEGFDKAINYLQKNIRELQDLATSMRMIPLSSVFGKMKRLVRETSSKKNNLVELVIYGGEVEVDRSVIEYISDPLVHMIRNSVDHGIELPAERKNSGKSETGTISLTAKRVGGEIWIEIKDDGKGINKEKLLAKAKEKGLISEYEEDLTDAKIYNLIFKPGLSTAEKVSDISGRGVGMDVVLKNIEKIRGRIDVTSEEGFGTTITLKIPLTTAIVDGMLMRIENSTYAIPTLDIKESLQVKESQIVRLIDGQEEINVRNKLIPVLRLQDIYSIKSQRNKMNEGIVVIADIGGDFVGILIDEVLGQQQLVIKPVPKYLNNIEGISGCAVLGNGEICLILDFSNLIKKVQSRNLN